MDTATELLLLMDIDEGGVGDNDFIIDGPDFIIDGPDNVVDFESA